MYFKQKVLHVNDKCMQNDVIFYNLKTLWRLIGVFKTELVGEYIRYKIGEQHYIVDNLG